MTTRVIQWASGSVGSVQLSEVIDDAEFDLFVYSPDRVGVDAGPLLVVVMLWRRHLRHPCLLMTIAFCTLVWLDALMNWATFAAYYPDLWHWPQDWPIVSVSSNVEPLFVAVFSMFVVPPVFPAIRVLRRLQAAKCLDTCVSRHPPINLSGLVFVFDFVHGFAMEQLCVRIGLYTFARVIPFGSVFTGTRWQFPLWQSSLISILMTLAAIQIDRDDTGRPVAEQLARRIALIRRFPVPASFVVLLVGVNLAFVAYGVVHTATTQWSGAAMSIVCPWPWSSTKVYDSQGCYEQSRVPAPDSAAIWSRWESAQPEGRPTVEAKGHPRSC